MITRRGHFIPGIWQRALCFLAGWCLAATSVSVFAQATLTTLVTNGPTSKRINLLVLSEGYQTNQLAQFLTDAASTTAGLFGKSPFSEYTNYFNVFAISVASVDTGADRPLSSPGTLKNTYFNSSFNSYGVANLLTIPPNNFDSNYANGKGKVLNLLTNLVPDYDVVIMIVNELSAGGSGDSGLSNNPPVTIVTINSSAPEIAAHEMGHALGGLADEYTNAYPGYVPVEKPNATAQTNRALIKWKSWIAETTAVPTLGNDTDIFYLVGLFPGAQYQPSGWYRPKYDCQMNHLGQPFCEVCSEQLVRSIYGLVRPVDSFAPASTNLSLYSTQTVTFTVTPMQPSTHSLSVAWITNGVAVAGATSTTFQVAPAVLGDGVHTVRSVVTDLTPLVLDDPLGLLKSTNTWTLNVSLSQLAITNVWILPTGQFRFTVTGAASAGFVIQGSTNLSAWTPVSTNTLVGGSYHSTNPVGSVPYRFYRAVTPP